MEGQKNFVQIDQNELFPYLLVNIGSGVSMIKVQSSFPLPFFLDCQDFNIGMQRLGSN